MERYLVYEGKRMKYGFTTGVCAAAAAKGGVAALVTGMRSDSVEIGLGDGSRIEIRVHEEERGLNHAIYKVIKESGDDPDITDGISVFARVERGNAGVIDICGGVGIGVVTKRGLPVEIGKPAINPKPLEMIERECFEAACGAGFDIEIYVPEGVELAKRTLNPKLGIEGGISILGTTGILKPMSEEAFKDALAVELKVSVAEHLLEEAVYVFGNYGKDFAVNTLNYGAEEVIVISNFVGFMIEKGCEQKLKKITFVGNIGKMVKVAGGIFHTHNRYADARLEIIAANAFLCGEPRENIEKILGSNTTEEAVEYITRKEAFKMMAEKAKARCEEYAKRNGWGLEVAVVIFSNEKGELGRSDNFLR